MVCLRSQDLLEASLYSIIPYLKSSNLHHTSVLLISPSTFNPTEKKVILNPFKLAQLLAP